MRNGSRIRLYMGTGLALAGLGMAALASVPALAAGTTANAEVKGSLTLSGLTSAFTLSGDPGTTQTVPSAVTMNVKANNKTGYNVTVTAAAPTMSGTAGNTDTIPVSALTVKNSTGGTYAPISNSAAVTVATTSTKSAGGGGDTVTNDYRMVIPSVNPDTYSVTLTYLLAANP